ncbi:hypothetical protein [Nocardia sp. NPDC058480]|uniref:hypothetical protein n=1 Tax=unclassified Nocardia TaxID=2637762 RepID=UPI00365EDA73
MSDREVVESVRFGTHQPAEYVKTATGQQVTPEFIDFLQQVLTGQGAESREPTGLDPLAKILADELAVLHLPEWRSPEGRKLAEATVTTIKQATRIAEYLVMRGVRLHPELEEIRWTPTPGGQPGAFDTGMHVVKDDDGQWPTPSPEDYYDLADIKVAQSDDGIWYATHPRGLACEARSKTEAYADLADQLRHRIVQARGEQ